MIFMICTHHTSLGSANDDLYDLYSPHIIRVSKSRRMGWVGHAVFTGGRGVKRNAWRVLVAEVEGKESMEDLGRDDRLISRWILQKCCGLDSSGSRWAQLQILVNREPPAPSQFYKRREISLLLNKMLAVSRSVFVCLNMFPLRAMKACKGSRYNM